MNFLVDVENRRVIIEASTLGSERELVIINEFEVLKKNFLEGTKDVYDCELVLLDVNVHDEDGNITEVETKAFARRIGIEQWLMNFNLKNYSKV